MAANFQRAPLMSRDDLNFLAITYSPETGPFPDTPLERLCLKVEVEEKMRHLESKNPPSPLSTLVRRSALLTAVAMNGKNYFSIVLSILEELIMLPSLIEQLSNIAGKILELFLPIKGDRKKQMSFSIGTNLRHVQLKRASSLAS